LEIFKKDVTAELLIWFLPSWYFLSSTRGSINNEATMSKESENQDSVYEAIEFLGCLLPQCNLSHAESYNPTTLFSWFTPASGPIASTCPSL
jgi:hypothetical protein